MIASTMSADQPPAQPLVADPTRPLRVAMYGAAHSHAPGKARVLTAHPRVEFCGVYEPDAAVRTRAQDNPAYAGVPWLNSPQQILDDPTIVAVCVEGPEGRCVETAHACVAAGKHIWYDKPAGDLAIFQSIVDIARERCLLVQMGYMLRYNTAFHQIDRWLREGLLGDLYAVRGHMSTSSSETTRNAQRYTGGVAFQLAPHIIDQVLWLFGGRPEKVTSFLRNDATPASPSHADNTLVVLEFERRAGTRQGMAMIDIAHMEPSPAARRFEVYGTRGSAIIVEPFEPGSAIRLALAEANAGYQKGDQRVEITPTPRAAAFQGELAAFTGALLGHQPPDRSLDHELLVEETLHRAVHDAAR